MPDLSPLKNPGHVAELCGLIPMLPDVAATWIVDCKTREQAALLYARALCTTAPPDTWAELNAAIKDRWSPSALVYIKEIAWKMVAP